MRKVERVFADNDDDNCNDGNGDNGDDNGDGNGDAMMMTIWRQ